MEDELGFQTFLFTREEALRRLEGHHLYTCIVAMAYGLWQDTVQLQARPDYVRHLALLREEESKLAAELAGGQDAGEPEIYERDAGGEEAARDSHT